MANYPKPTKGSKHNAGSHFRSGVKDSLREQRQIEADERNADWASLTPQEQIASLDKRLGKGKGAKAQRARIAKLLAAPKVETPPEAKSDKKAKQAKKEAHDKAKK